MSLFKSSYHRHVHRGSPIHSLCMCNFPQFKRYFQFLTSVLDIGRYKFVTTRSEIDARTNITLIKFFQYFLTKRLEYLSSLLKSITSHECPLVDV